MPDDIVKLNIIAHKFGQQLLDAGIKFIRIAYKLNPKVFTRAEILTFLIDQTSIPASSLSVADEKIYVESWTKWGNIIDFDLINQQIYQPDFFDCDNYSFSYASRASMIYGLNSCGVAFGSIHNPITKQLIGYHAFNLIITHEEGILKLYLYEPMTDSSTLWIKGQDNSLQNPGWIYKPNWIILF